MTSINNYICKYYTINNKYCEKCNHSTPHNHTTNCMSECQMNSLCNTCISIQDIRKQKLNKLNQTR